MCEHVMLLSYFKTSVLKRHPTYKKSSADMASFFATDLISKDKAQRPQMKKTIHIVSSVFYPKDLLLLYQQEHNETRYQMRRGKTRTRLEILVSHI